MSASQPEAGTEYSTRSGPSGGVTGGRGRGRGVVVGLGLTGAALLFAAELTPLLRVETVARHPGLLRTVQTGPHHGWALVPIAVFAAALSLAAGSRPDRARLPHALLALLGLLALGVALIADLPDVHATGLVGTPATGLHDAAARAQIGLYLETLGAVTLLLAAGVGTALAPRPRSRGHHRR